MTINSDKNTILVFSDPHQEIERVEYLLKHENYDTVVCLGDWFDSFTHNSEFHVEETCKFLKKWIFKKNFFTCIGNHDVQYLYDNNTSICSGYERSKDVFITDCLGKLMPEIRNRFKWYLWIDDFLCSHAGVSTYHFPARLDGINKQSITGWLDDSIKMGEMSLINGGYHWLYGCGAARGGRMSIGGLTWQDFRYEFAPIEGLNQLVGHTPHNTIMKHSDDDTKNLEECKNLDVDCHLNQYLTIFNGKLTIKNFKDL